MYTYACEKDCRDINKKLTVFIFKLWDLEWFLFFFFLYFLQLTYIIFNDQKARLINTSQQRNKFLNQN